MKYRWFQVAVLVGFCAAAGLSVAPQVSFANAGSKDAPKNPKKKPPPAPKQDDSKVGYSETEIQLKGMMVPYRTGGAIDYEPLMIRLQVAPGPNERAACFMAPVVHEKILMYLHTANLQPVDFTGERRNVLSKNLLDVAIKTTDRSFYSGVMLVDPSDPPELDAKSKTLSSQCS